MQIGAKVYYDKTTGDVLVNTGERSGNVVETTVEQDFEVYRELTQRVPESVGMIQFEFGAHVDDYAAGGALVRLNPETLEPLFTYSHPESSPEPRPALSTQVSALESETAALNLAVIDLWETLANGGAA